MEIDEKHSALDKTCTTYLFMLEQKKKERAGAPKETITQIRKYHVSVRAVQEVRWKECGEMKCDKAKFYYSGNLEKAGHRGTGFIVDLEIEKSVIGFKPISDRMYVLRLKGR